MSFLLASIAALGVASAMPTSPNVLAARQDDDALFVCRENSCDDCPGWFAPNDGWPECSYYTGDQLTDNGFPVQDNGQIQIFIDVPEQEPDCRVLIRTPVRSTDQDCGGNVLVAEGATCAPIVIDNTFIMTSCCGVDECARAGAPGKRSVNTANNPFRAASSSMLLLHDKNGRIIEPHAAASLQALPPQDANVQSRNSVAASFAKKLTKRDCGDFTATRGPYSQGGRNYIISDTVSCSPTESCTATIGEEVTEETSFSTEVSVSDPFDIISASIGFEFSQSVTQSFEGSWTFGPGERGYVVFIPYITCVEGYFSGDCDDDGVETTICGAQGSEDTIQGEQRAVLIRG